MTLKYWMYPVYLLLLCSTASFDLAAKENSTLKTPVKATQSSTALINLNTADAKQLAMLPGIGESKALRIISYRDKHGKIKSLKQLSEINGLGERSIAKLEGKVKF